MTDAKQQDDLVNLEIDGKAVTARKGQMLIEATDAANAYVPRFCYHEKLTVAANCRMCLVEVERAPKPLPACATPVAEGMKVSTKSAYAIAAQRATMEFLLINHPLDCPICDQGGECELQDLAMGYGRDVSRYTEKKRVVKDKNIGPLVSTDMTRFIHCTRCVRFGKEIQGIQELGTTGRGEQMQIGTYIENNVDHELSGNIIDLCPVGALNNKPYRYSARAWEMVQQPLVSPHDCVGSNLFAHTLRGTIKRIVPRPNEAINETWIADRDRFSYEGIYAQDRLQTPRIKTDGEWQEVSWQQALEAAAQALRSAGSDTGFVVSPSATLEEGYLLQRLADHLGSAHIDHRLQRRDVRDQTNDPVFPYLGRSLESLDTLDGALIVGGNLRHEAPIVAHRIRKAAVNNNAAVASIDVARTEYFFPMIAQVEDGLVAGVAATLAAAAELTGTPVPDVVASFTASVDVTEAHRRAAQSLVGRDDAVVLLGLVASAHESFSELRLLAVALAKMTGATVGYLSAGANSAGLSLLGVLPHRAALGRPVASTGKSVSEMLATPPGCVVLWNAEPGRDFGTASTSENTGLQGADTVIAVTPFLDDNLAAFADIVLPMGTFAETAGTYVNVEGRAQSWHGVATPVGEARPGWKILRVLGNALELPDCDYVDAAAVSREALDTIDGSSASTDYLGDFAPQHVNGQDSLDRAMARPIYEVDSVVRRARALQMTKAGVEGSAVRRQELET
ncbi:MAG: NADH-quinone oxidoreductase subunit NuoG [Pseudomonadota bacterium]